MRLAGALLMLALGSGSAWAESLVATRTLRANSLIGPDDVALADRAAPPGAAIHAEEVVGTRGTRDALCRPADPAFRSRAPCAG